MLHLIKRIGDCMDEDLHQIIISNPRRSLEIRKYNIRPVLLKGKLLFQSAAYTGTQVFHENLDREAMLAKMEEVIPLYKQVQVQTAGMEFTALVGKKGKAAIKINKKAIENSKAATGEADAADKLARLSHNRSKHYLLPEGEPVPFLVDLGVMTREGKIVKSRYDKYRQINRFLEFIEDILPGLPGGREITILDFGCGKSYLTFAMYYYLHEQKGLDIRIIGLDLKKDVIRRCSSLAVRYGYEKLHFYEGAIEDYQGLTQVDMVVTLHACDTATDFALYKAVNWGARVILSVPCCQHELNMQMGKENAAAGQPDDFFGPVREYGILKERFCALATDGIRAKLLESKGYEVQILEFIDMEHTPKNLLIRAVKPSSEKGRKPDRTRGQKDSDDAVREFCRTFGFKPTLAGLFAEDREQEA